MARPAAVNSIGEDWDPESFGVYRPVTRASRERIYGLLSDIVPELDRLTSWKKGRRFKVESAMGVTFVPRSRVEKVLAQTTLLPGSLNRIRNDVYEHPELQHNNTPLDLDDFRWVGAGANRLVVKFKRSGRFDEIHRQSSVITGLFQAAGIGVSAVPPDHITLYQFGSFRDFASQRRREENMMWPETRNEIVERVSGYMREEGITSAVLAGIMAGQGRDAPLSRDVVVPSPAFTVA